MSPHSLFSTWERASPDTHMAIGTGADFKIYDELVIGRMIERQQQNINAFNAASRNALRLSTRRIQGNYAYESFFKKVTLVSRRNVASVSPVADTPITQGENVTVKINRKIGPVSHTLDAFKKIGIQANVESVSEALGQQVADDMTADMLNTGVLGLAAATKNQSSQAIAATGTTLITTDLVDMLAKMGDKAERVIMWVMHSKPFFNLIKSQITDKIEGVASFVIAQASPITLNRPVLVTDCPALKTAGASPLLDTYTTLGVVEGGLNVEDSEETTFWSQEITGLENLAVRYQGEYAYNVGLKGFTWDVGNGGANPTDNAVGTGSNWDKTATSQKDLAAVSIITK